MEKMISGFNILRAVKAEQYVGHSNRSIILVDKGCAYAQRYVTAEHFEGEAVWIHGRYFDSLVNAERDLEDRK